MILNINKFVCMNFYRNFQNNRYFLLRFIQFLAAKICRAVISMRQDEAGASSRFLPFFKKRLIEKIIPRKKKLETCHGKCFNEHF